MILKVAVKNIFHKLNSSLLNVLLVIVGISSITFFGLLQKQFEEKFEKNFEGIDMVLGASGSPLQLILSAIYHIDTPTGNISERDAKRWMNHPYIEKAIPLAYGDSYKSYSIVGTNQDYIAHYDATLKEGSYFKNAFEVTLGYEIARNLNLNLGDKFYGTHGNQEGGHVHENYGYVVVGVLEPTGKIIDQLVLCNIESIWLMHEEHAHDDKQEHHHDERKHHSKNKHQENNDETLNDNSDREYTAVLLKMKNKMAMFQLPRLIKKDNPEMQLALPIVEINKLFSNLGIGIKILNYISFIIMFISGLSIFLSLANTFREKKQELAIMRTLGGSKLNVFSLIVLESLILCLSGYILGVIIGTLVYTSLNAAFAEEYKIVLQPFAIDTLQQSYLLIVVLIIAFLSAIIPALKAYHLDISKTLSDA